MEVTTYYDSLKSTCSFEGGGGGGGREREREGGEGGGEDCKGGGREVGKRDQAVILDCIHVRYEAQELSRNPRLDAQPTQHEKWIFMFFMAA